MLVGFVVNQKFQQKIFWKKIYIYYLAGYPAKLLAKSVSGTTLIIIHILTVQF